MLALGAIFTACEGPAGPAGKDGLNGTNGTNGTNGKDGNATCGVCHNAGTVMYAKILEYENSVHFTGGDLEGSNGNPCIGCHTSEGFVQRAASGLDTATFLIRQHTIQLTAVPAILSIPTMTVPTGT